MNEFPLIVLDASAALALVLTEKEGEEVEMLAREILEDNGQIFVPELFWYEVSNGLLSAERRGRIGRRELSSVIAELSRLPIICHTGSDASALVRTMELAARHNLTFYDASYLELAVRFEARLKSFDTHILALKDEYPLILLPVT